MNENGKSLESWIWDAACSIRGAQEAPKFKDLSSRSVENEGVRHIAAASSDGARRTAESFPTPQEWHCPHQPHCTSRGVCQTLPDIARQKEQDRKADGWAQAKRSVESLFSRIVRLADSRYLEVQQAA
jgi:hypothetical protein